MIGLFVCSAVCLFIVFVGRGMSELKLKDLQQASQSVNIKSTHSCIANKNSLENAAKISYFTNKIWQCDFIVRCYLDKKNYVQNVFRFVWRQKFVPQSVVLLK